ncbi:MAG: hypothetical protein ACRDWY_05655, partial [Actinomycetes bacterium]
ELAGVQALVAAATPGDVVGVMCHAEREEIVGWITSVGGTVDSPEAIREKVLRAQPPQPRS